VMEYAWEKRISKATLDRINEMLPPEFHLVGVAVENVETAEGALICKHLEAMNVSVLSADVWRDIYGDAASRYTVSINAMWGDIHD